MTEAKNMSLECAKSFVALVGVSLPCGEEMGHSFILLCSSSCSVSLSYVGVPLDLLAVFVEEIFASLK